MPHLGKRARRLHVDTASKVGAQVFSVVPAERDAGRWIQWAVFFSRSQRKRSGPWSSSKLQFEVSNPGEKPGMGQVQQNNKHYSLSSH